MCGGGRRASGGYAHTGTGPDGGAHARQTKVARSTLAHPTGAGVRLANGHNGCRRAGPGRVEAPHKGLRGAANQAGGLCARWPFASPDPRHGSERWHKAVNTHNRYTHTHKQDECTRKIDIRSHEIGPDRINNCPPSWRWQARYNVILCTCVLESKAKGNGHDWAGAHTNTTDPVGRGRAGKTSELNKFIHLVVSVCLSSCSFCIQTTAWPLWGHPVPVGLAWPVICCYCLCWRRPLESAVLEPIVSSGKLASWLVAHTIGGRAGPSRARQARLANVVAPEGQRVNELAVRLRWLGAACVMTWLWFISAPLGGAIVCVSAGPNLGGRYTRRRPLQVGWRPQSGWAKWIARDESS